jgi:hypothetical protein
MAELLYIELYSAMPALVDVLDRDPIVPAPVGLYGVVDIILELR